MSVFIVFVTLFSLFSSSASLCGGSRLAVRTVVLENLLPGQCFQLRTDDQAFCSFIRTVGVRTDDADDESSHGMIGVLGIEPETKRVMRHGVLAAVTRLEDVPMDGGLGTDVTITALEMALVIGDGGDIGRWRRCYSPPESLSGAKPGFGFGPESLSRVGCDADDGGERAGDASARLTKMEFIDPDAAPTRSPTSTASAAALELEQRLQVHIDEGVPEIEGGGAIMDAALLRAWLDLHLGAPTASSSSSSGGGSSSSGGSGSRRRPSPESRPHAFALWAAALLAPVPPRPLRPGGLRPKVLNCGADTAAALRCVSDALDRRRERLLQEQLKKEEGKEEGKEKEEEKSGWPPPGMRNNSSRSSSRKDRPFWVPVQSPSPTPTPADDDDDDIYSDGGGGGGCTGEDSED
jgi:hypothetical protein